MDIKKSQTLFLNKIRNIDFDVIIFIVKVTINHKNCSIIISKHLNDFKVVFASIFDFAYLFRKCDFQWLVFTGQNLILILHYIVLYNRSKVHLKVLTETAVEEGLQIYPGSGKRYWVNSKDDCKIPK